MDKISENTSCYAKDEQRNVLLHLSENEIIRNNFFLTGGTALSVFYLHHREAKHKRLPIKIKKMAEQLEFEYQVLKFKLAHLVATLFFY